MLELACILDAIVIYVHVLSDRCEVIIVQY